MVWAVRENRASSPPPLFGRGHFPSALRASFFTDLAQYKIYNTERIIKRKTKNGQEEKDLSLMLGVFARTHSDKYRMKGQREREREYLPN